MKISKWLIALACLLQFTGAFAQNYSDGIETLMEIKYASQDVARAIENEWDHNSPQYLEARKKYSAIKRSVDQMISTFDAKIRSGQKITTEDIERYVQMAANNCEALADHYNTYSHAGGTNGLFGIDKILPIILEIFKGVTTVIDTVQEYQVQKRLSKMHEALDPCKLVTWDNV
ncbi:MAG: hypothetical protein ACOYPR_13100 [Saprospiraceae bacterium]|jgi:hypothetical protein